jgi:hypothetical protein
MNPAVGNLVINFLFFFDKTPESIMIVYRFLSVVLILKVVIEDLFKKTTKLNK